MKKIFVLCILLGLGRCAVAQIGVRINNITQVVFPSEIDYYRGGFIPSDFVIDQKSNILFITPTHITEQTNISVVLKDGCVYSLSINYLDTMTRFLVSFTQEDAGYIPEYRKAAKDCTAAKETKTNESTMDRIIGTKAHLFTQNTSHYKKLFFILKGVYVCDNVIYIRLSIDNKSNIRFDFDYLAFYVSSKKKKKKISGEQLQLMPKEEYGYSNVIASDAKQEMVFAFDKFTIGEDRLLYIDLVEKNGERNLKLKISDALILNASKL